MTKYELLKETVGCRPIVINCIHSLEDDLNEAEKIIYEFAKNEGYFN